MRRAIAVAAVVVLIAALPAKAAAPVSLRLGGDYLFDGGPGIFSLQLGLETPLGRTVSVGGRFGGLLTTSPTTGGIPLDVFLRFRLGRVYLEGVGGPWFFFSGNDTLRGHAAVGFGLLTRNFEFGAEFGYLSPSRTQLGARLGFRL
jgi:hypothetical protein